MENAGPETQYLKFVFHFSGVANTETQPDSLKSRLLSTLGFDPHPPSMVGRTHLPQGEEPQVGFRKLSPCLLLGCHVCFRAGGTGPLSTL